MIARNLVLSLAVGLNTITPTISMLRPTPAKPATVAVSVKRARRPRLRQWQSTCYWTSPKSLHRHWQFTPRCSFPSSCNVHLCSS